MREQHAADGVHRIEDAYTNFYLVQDNGSLTVVDTGLPASWKSLQEAVRTLGRSLSDIQAVVLTHAHYDHMGFARRARKELGVPVYAREREVDLCRRPWSFDHEDTMAKYP